MRIILFLLIFSAFLHAAEEEVGMDACAFLKIDVGARAAALGGAYTAVSDDATASFWNPAGLLRFKGWQVCTMYNSYIQGMKHYFLSYAESRQRMAYAVSISSLIVDGIELRSKDTEEPEGEGEAKDFAASFAMAKSWGKLLCGWGIKLLKAKLVQDYSRLSYTFDLGITYAWKKAAIGMVVQNWGGKVKFRQTSHPLPLRYKIGASYKIKDSVLLLFDACFPRRGRAHVHSGVEVKIGGLFLRMGVNDAKDIGEKVTFGFGVKRKFFSIDYAWSSFGLLGYTHRVGVTFAPPVAE